MTSPSTGEATAGFTVPVCASVVPGEHWSSISATISSRPPFPLVATHVAAFPSRCTPASAPASPHNAPLRRGWVEKEQAGAKLSFLNFSLHAFLRYHKIMFLVSCSQLHYFCGSSVVTQFYGIIQPITQNLDVMWQILPSFFLRSEYMSCLMCAEISNIKLVPVPRLS